MRNQITTVYCSADMQNVGILGSRIPFFNPPLPLSKHDLKGHFHQSCTLKVVLSWYKGPPTTKHGSHRNPNILHVWAQLIPSNAGLHNTAYNCNKNTVIYANH